MNFSKIVLVMAGCLAGIANVGTAHAFCNSAPNSTCHHNIVRNAFEFLRPWIRDELAAHVRDPDDLSFINDRSAYHFDDCNFDGGTASINSRYLRSNPESGVISGLSPLRRRSTVGQLSFFRDYPLIQSSLRSWASALHTAQDFYSHSNWVEMGLTRSSADIFDRRRDRWREISANWDRVHGDVGDGFGDVLASQRPWPAGWSLSFPAHPYVPVVTDSDGRRHHLLVSGEAGWPNSCPSGTHFSHDDELNKDDSVAPAGSGQSAETHRLAALMATHQTRHEWCRLQRMVLARTGPPGAGVLMGLLVDPQRSPHPRGSICQRREAGPVLVTVSIDLIRVLRDKEGDGAGQQNFVFAVFTEDMRRSGARQVGEIRVEAGALVPTGELPGRISLCMNNDERLIATLQGWENDGETGRNELTAQDQLLNGVTHAFGAVSGLPRQPVSNTMTKQSDNGDAPDLRVRFRITRSVGNASVCTTIVP